MDISAQGGSNPQSANPGGTQPGVDPTQIGVPSTPEVKTVNPEPDYKSFFEEQMDNRLQERASIEAKLNDSKISREEKMNLRERDIALREELMKHQYQQGPAQAPDLSFVPESKRALLQQAMNASSPDEAKAIVDFARQMFSGVNTGWAQPSITQPVNLDSGKGGVPPGQREVKFNSANLLWVDADKDTVEGTRKWFWDFLATLQA